MKPGIVTGTARWKLALAVCGLALLAGCGSGSTSPATSPSTPASPSAPATSPSAAPSPSNSSALCDDAAALRAALDQLRHINVQPGAVSEITSDVTNVKSALTTLVTNAHGRFQAQTSALSTALNTLSTSVGSLRASPGVSTVSGVVSALGQVNTAGQKLLAVVNTDCPSASPSSSA